MRSRRPSHFTQLMSFIAPVPISPRAPIVSPTSPPLPPWPGVIHGMIDRISTAGMHGHVLTPCPTSSWRSTCDLSSRICSAPQAHRAKSVRPGQPLPATCLQRSFANWCSGRAASNACLLACLLLNLPKRGNSARSALAGQGAAAEAAARFALRCQCALPASTAIARPGRSGLMPAVNRPPFFSLCVRVS